MDDDNDPEYHVLVDEEQEAATDKEELRADRAVKVSKKELTDLMAELSEYTEMLSSDDEESTIPEVPADSVKSEYVFVQRSLDPFALCTYIQEHKLEHRTIFTHSQSWLLKQQMRQHIQLSLQGFLLSYKHTHLDSAIADGYKNILVELRELRNMQGECSYFNMATLDGSFQYLVMWENFMEKSHDTTTNRFTNAQYRADKRLPEVPLNLMKFCFSSGAFPYPLLLPTCGFLETHDSKPLRFRGPEARLIALLIEDIVLKFQLDVHNCHDLKHISNLIHYLVMPVRTECDIYKYIKRMVKSEFSNPIKNLVLNNIPVKVVHYVIPLPKVLYRLYKHPKQLLPDNWKLFVETELEELKSNK